MAICPEPAIEKNTINERKTNHTGLPSELPKVKALSGTERIMHTDAPSKAVA